MIPQHCVRPSSRSRPRPVRNYRSWRNRHSYESFRSKPPKDIRLGDVVRATEPDFVHALVVGDLVGDVSLVEGAIELGKLVTLCGDLFGERATGVVIFWFYIEFFDQCESLPVHRGMIAHHIVRKVAHFLVF